MTLKTNKYFKPETIPTLVPLKRVSAKVRREFRDEGISGFPGKSGYGHSPTLAPVPTLNLGTGAKVFKNDYLNAYIKFDNDTLTTDGRGGISDGYGGAGISSPTIDLTVGVGGAYAREEDDRGERLLSNPNNKIDAARLYITAMSDTDDAFSLPEGFVGGKKAMSAVAMGADAVRIAAWGEGGVKIVSNPRPRSNRPGSNRNMENGGIDLIVGEGEDLQPVPKGNNLLECLVMMGKEIDDNRELFNAFVKSQGEYNDKILSHNHNSPFANLPSAPAYSIMFAGFKQMFDRVADVEAGAIQSIVKKASNNSNYFNPLNEKYILSAMVHSS
jgi:hypothetical protein